MSLTKQTTVLPQRYKFKYEQHNCITDLTLTKMTSTQVFEASVTTNNSSPQNYTKPADQPTTYIHSIDLVNLSLFIGSFNTDNSFDSHLAR